MPINALFAVDQSGGMGFAGSLPWPHNPLDMANFKKLTMGHVLVMGRKSWQDPKMPKPLKGRTVYVASSAPVEFAGHITGNLNEVLPELELKHPDQTIWVAGGATILEQCAPLFNRIHLTYMHGSYKIDTRVQLRSLLAGFRPIEARVAPGTNCVFVTYENLFRRAPDGP